MNATWFAVVMACCSTVATADPTPAPNDTPYRYWPATEREGQKHFEDALNRIPTAKSLRAYHALIGETPHVAGTENDLRAAETLAAEFKSLGLDVEKQELWLYLSLPLAAELEIVSPVSKKLSLKEDVLPEDRYSGHPDLGFGWNAYSGSGEVTGGLVYANYGTKEDFEKLREIGVDVAGKIVIVRYGGNFRGYKAKFAEAAGAIGLIIYTDPADSGYARGLMYPEGGYANASYIQRGSILALDYDGDPLTPFEPAVKDAKRLDPKNVALPHIPVQPIGWGAAHEILVRMRGSVVPKGWQGGLPFTYRVTSDDDLKVRLMVRQSRELKKVYNVVGTLRGAIEPERSVIVGCHYDAWGFGASDPLAGTMVLLESAKSFARMARDGRPPARSIVFANWAAEEHGILGSVEWVEAHHDELLAGALAYINLDMAAMGVNFRAGAAPSLQTLIADATRAVRPPSAGEGSAATVFDAWTRRAPDDLRPGYPRFGNLGGGSDHVGFYCHLAIPSAGLGAGGAKGTAYHSNYDTLAWYRKVVPGYEPARAVTGVTNLVLARLANAPLVPLDPVRVGPDIRRHIASLAFRAKELKVEVDFSKIEKMSKEYEDKARTVYADVLARLDRGELSAEQRARVNDVLREASRAWYYTAGMPGGMDWFRNLYAASDPNSGYAAWMLPGYRWSIETHHPPAIFTARKAYCRVFYNLLRTMDELAAAAR